MSERIIEAVKNADSDKEIENILETHHLIVLGEEIAAFYSGFMGRPVQSKEELLDFIKFLADEEDESDEKVIEYARVIETYLDKNGELEISEQGIEDLETWIKRAHEYKDMRNEN